jgi:hypothetical protein
MPLCHDASQRRCLCNAFIVALAVAWRSLRRVDVSRARPHGHGTANIPRWMLFFRACNAARAAFGAVLLSCIAESACNKGALARATMVRDSASAHDAPQLNVHACFSLCCRGCRCSVAVTKTKQEKIVALPPSHTYGHPAPLVPSGSSPRDASLISTPRPPVHHLPRLLTPTHRLGKGVRHGCVALRFILRSAAWHVQEKHVSARGPRRTSWCLVG